MNPEILKTMFPDKIAAPPIDTEAIDRFVDDPDGETKARQLAEQSFKREACSNEEDCKDRLSHLEAEKQRLLEQKDTKYQELGATPKSVFIKITDLIDEFAKVPTVQIALMLFLAIFGVPLLAMSTSLVASQSTRFEFLLEWPIAAVMFLFVPLMTMWLVSWIDELIKQEQTRWLYRMSLGLGACVLAIIWAVCFVLANSLDATADPLEGASSLIDGLFVTLLVTQIIFEIITGGILKIWIFYKLDEPYASKEVSVLNHTSLSKTINEIIQETNLIDHKITILRKHMSAVQNGCAQHISDAVGYFKSQQKRANQFRSAARKKAEADAAAYEFEQFYANDK
ncbi:MAG: hypothetical protein ACRBBJ_08945 [Rhodomicrobiaceae bacterium]